MARVLSRRQMDEATGHAGALNLHALVAPTADDLLTLTQAALNDLDPPLWMTAEQREQLRLALRARLAGQLTAGPGDAR